MSHFLGVLFFFCCDRATSSAFNNPKVVLEEVLNTFQRQRNTEDEELSASTDDLISHLPKLYNRTQ